MTAVSAGLHRLNIKRLAQLWLAMAALAAVGVAISLPGRSSERVTAPADSTAAGLSVAQLGPAFGAQQSAAASAAAWRKLPGLAQASISRAMGRHDASFHATTVAGALQLSNPAGGVTARFGRDGSQLSAGGANVRLALASVGYGDALRRVAAVTPRADLNRVVYSHPGVSEWFVNGPAGLEHGFTLAHRPAGAGQGDLTLGLSLPGGTRAHTDQDGRGATLSDGHASLRYSGLWAVDARGRTLPARLSTAGGQLRVAVDDRAARYPITIDPFVGTAVLQASDKNTGDRFGHSVAISGDTIVVGTYYATLHSGAVYVFVRPPSGWADATETAQLKSTSADAGYSVAIDGDTIVAGAPGSDFNYFPGGERGAAYVFVRPSGGWVNATQTATLTSSLALTRGFGAAVGVSGGTIVVGAPLEDGSLDGAQGGQAFVFERPASGWANATETAALRGATSVGPDPAEGLSVAVAGDTIVVGDPDTAVAYVYTRPAGGWTAGPPAAKLTASDIPQGHTRAFGFSLAVAGDTVVVGAYGGGGPDPGAVYVFARPASGWADMTQTAKLTASDGAPGDLLGASVAIAGDRIVAGAPGDRFGGELGRSDSVYVFARPADGWVDATQTQKLRFETVGGPASLGGSVAIAGDTILAGSRDEQAFVFTPGDPPETTIDSGPNGPPSHSSVQFIFSSSQFGSTFECSLDHSAFASCSSPFLSDVSGDGAHTFEVRATDPSGNTDPTPASRTFTVDTVPPDTTIDSGPAGTTPTRTPTFTFSSSEPNSTFLCRVGGGGFQPCSSPFTTSTLPDGTYKFTVQATDAAGNPDTTPASRTFTVDTTPPETSIVSGPSGLTNDSTPEFTFASSESPEFFECKVDDRDAVGCGSSYEVTPALADGPHTIVVTAFDDVDNGDPTPASRSFTVDTTAPDTTITAGPAGPTTDDTPTFSFSSPDAGATFECNTGSGFVACASPYTSTHLGDGTYTFQVRATDAAGNTDATPASRMFTVDTTAPDTTITAGPSGTITTPTAQFSFSSEAGATFECRVDTAAFAACSSPFITASLANGQHTFQVRATDAVGNTDQTPASRTFTVAVDTTPPETTITAGPTGPTNNNRPTFSFSSEAGATFECRVDNAAFAACTSPLTTTTLADGAHTFQVRATDTAGNTDQSPASRSFTVDTVPPDTTITAGPTGASTNTSPTFAFSSTEQSSTFQCSMDGAAFTGCSSPRTTTVGGGAHTFAVRAIDAAGNVDPTPATRSFRVCTGLLGGVGVLLNGILPNTGLLCS